jgi:hypothetical protein
MGDTDHTSGLPESLLDQIFEHTNNGNNGGFILAFISDEGEVNVISKASAPVIELGLIKGVETWLENVLSQHEVNAPDSED